jgi:Bacterial PH domain/Short C-terminal domain
MAVKDELLGGESIVFETEKHWIAPLRDSLIPILLLVGAVILTAISPSGDGIAGFLGNILDLIRTVMVVVAIGWIVYNIVVWRTAEFVVTTHRVIREEGLISRRSSATMLTSVTDVQSRVPFLGAQLGYGDLVIFTQSGEAGVDRFMSITDPKTFRDQMMGAKLGPRPASPTIQAPATPPVQAPAATPAPEAPPASDTDQLATLAQLADLRDRGAITAEEYEAKKTELLSRI